MGKIRIDEDTLVKFFPTTMARTQVSSITLGEIQTMSSGIFAHHAVLEYRRLLPGLSKDERSKHKAANIPCCQLQQSPDGSLLPNLPIDYENCDVEIPEEWIFMRFKSVGGEGECIVLRMPDEVCESKEAWESYAKRVIAFLGIDSSKGQHSIDRMRFISHDENFKVNWMVEPFVLSEPEQIPFHSNGHSVDNEPKHNTPSNGFDLNALLPMDNNTGLSIFSHLRGKRIPVEEVKTIMRSLPRKSESLATDVGLDGYIEKWEKQYFANESDQAGGITQKSKPFKDYIIRVEPVAEIPVWSIGGTTILSKGNVTTVFGLPKSMKTRFAKSLTNQFKLRTGFIDTEQGSMHAWLTSKSLPTADLFHMRGQDQTEIQRVAWEIANSGEYEILIIDNIRDAACLDFNDTIMAANMEMFLKRISLQIPVVCIAHQNKNSKSISGHMGNALEKISQTMIHCQLSDIENPSAGAIVSCYRSRDEPFRQCMLTIDGHLTNDSVVKSAGKSMLLDDLLRIIGGQEYTRNELNETYADLFDITPKTAANEITKLKRLHPGVITERKEGKTKIFNVSSTVK